MNRREFLSSALLAAAMPPGPPGMDFKPLRSPKDAEFQDSLKKVPSSLGVQAVSPRPQVVPGQVTGITISAANNVATISWQDGTPPFKIYRADDLPGPWLETPVFTMKRTAALPTDGPRGFFRIREQVPLPVTAELQADGAHVSWVLPEF